VLSFDSFLVVFEELNSLLLHVGYRAL